MIKKLLWSLVTITALTIGTFAVNTMTAVPPRAATGEFKQIQLDAVTLSYHALKNGGPTILLFPSAGRPASDFNELVTALQQAGYSTIAVEPRGMRDDSGLDSADTSLFDLADDIAAITANEGVEKHLLIGHAYGNRVVRAYATRHTSASLGVVLLAAGGSAPIDPKYNAALSKSFWTFMPDWWREGQIRSAFFAGDNPVPDYWMGGWSTQAALLAGRTKLKPKAQEWLHAGGVPMLVVQAMQDKIAPPEHAARVIKTALGDRVEVVEIDNAGHAMLSEQPAQVHAAVIAFANKHLR
ncbi:MAG: alpha/beta hydrolase [Halioglobus sp.]